MSSAKGTARKHTDPQTALTYSGRLALLAVLVGGCIVIATTWLGVRQWYQRWKQERADDL